MKRKNGSGPTTWGLCCAFLFIIDPSSGDAHPWRVPYDSPGGSVVRIGTSWR